MKDLDIFFDATFPADALELLVTTGFQLINRPENNTTVKSILDIYKYKHDDVVAVIRIPTREHGNNETNETTGNMYFIANTIKIKIESCTLKQIYLEIPCIYQFNTHDFFIKSFFYSCPFNVMWDTENVGCSGTISHIYAKSKIYNNSIAKIIDLSDDSLNRRSCITFQIIHDSR